ncbi:hypothetical protein FNF28_01578 [Cafeteria roenbergensis]|uniref:dAMP1 SANT/Myb-like domain-containing protein n=1 Tax=Cafeteria roenbergensis TaxID=33653 RepID=A0A5A8E385_CAFRO|nr:hypothetical protein FNF28_01578 [Cafeteria roenbergensis]
MSSDVADIMRGAGAPADSSSGAAAGRSSRSGAAAAPVRPHGLSREAFALMDAGSLPSMAPAEDRSLAALVRRMRGKKTAKWAWRPFTSSARSKDSLQLSHWVRASAEFPDYPFARFNKKIDLIRYTDEDYRKYLAPSPDAPSTDPDSQWTREMTDTLFDLCRRYDLRWAVIRDRFPWRFVQVEELKRRFYTVMSRVIRARINALPANSNSAIGRTQYTDFHYDPELDSKRRRHVHGAYSKTKPERLLQERLLLDELRVIDERLEQLRAAAKGGTIASAILAEAVTSDRHRLEEHAMRPTDAELAPAKEGRPRGGPAAWNGKTSCLDAFTGVRLRSEQINALPDGTPHASRLHIKVTSLLGELGVAAAAKIFPSAATLHALTVLRRQSAALLRLQQAVDLRERAVMALQITRKTMAVVPLKVEDPLKALEAARMSARSHAAAAAAASGGGGPSSAAAAASAASQAARSRAVSSVSQSIATAHGGAIGVAKNSSGGITLAHAPQTVSRKRSAPGDDAGAKRPR